jgi:hypothetical protein
MPSFPALDKTVCNHPHVVILGAGASLAAFPKGDAYGQKIPLMNDLVEVTGLEPLLRRAGINIGGVNFEALYDDLASFGKNDSLVREVQDRVRRYFTGLQITDGPTIYDYLLLSLRSKDIIATFNWDPLLAQAHERNLNVGELPEILYLHGNVGMGLCHEHRMLGFEWQDCVKCGAHLSPTKLLFPVKEKNYTEDPFISYQWEVLQHYIEHAYRITIFGYSAPVSDVAARSLMLKVWRANQVREFSQLEVVDIKPKKELKETWVDFIVRNNYGFLKKIFDTYMFHYPRRSCDAFAGATLQQRPWKENRMLRFKSLDELQQWVAPLVEEERRYNETKVPFSDKLVLPS